MRDEFAGYYKFLNSEHLHYLIGGSIKFTSLASFRWLEESTGDAHIGDKGEGISTASFVIRNVTADCEEAKASKSFGIHIEDRIDELNVSGMTNAFPHCLVFCFTHANYGESRRVMCSNDSLLPSMRYDASVKIKDAESLLRKIASGTTMIAGVQHRIEDICSHIIGGEVVYTSREFHGFNQSMEADPFKKQPKYSYQNEARIVLVPKRTFRLDTLLVTIEGAADVLQIQEDKMEVGREQLKSVQGPDLSQENVIANMLAFADLLDQWWAPLPFIFPNRSSDFMQEVANSRAHQAEEQALYDQCSDKFAKRGRELYWLVRQFFGKREQSITPLMWLTRLRLGHVGRSTAADLRSMVDQIQTGQYIVRG